MKHCIFVSDHVIPEDVEAPGPREYFVAHYHNYAERPPWAEEGHHPEEAVSGPWGVSEFGTTPEEALERLYTRLRSLGIEPPHPKT